jgi:hypothetical protein
MKKKTLLILSFIIGTFHFLKAQKNDTINSNASGKIKRYSLLNVFPDSRNGTFHIVYGSATKDPPPGWGGKLIINIVNSISQIVYSETILDFEGEYNKIIDLNNEEKGVYIIEVIIDKQGKIEKEVLVSSTDDETKDNSLLNVFPNPTDGTFQIVYASDTQTPPDGWGGELIVNIINPDGKVVYAETILNFEGEYNKTINMGDGKKGMYIIKVGSGNQGKSKREILK